MSDQSRFQHLQHCEETMTLNQLLDIDTDVSKIDLQGHIAKAVSDNWRF